MDENERKAALSKERGRRYRQRDPDRVRELASARARKLREINPGSSKAANKRHVEKLKARPEIDVLKERETRFWSLVHKGGASDCWEWLGNRTQQNYGRFNISSGYWRSASRVAYMLVNGPLEDGYFACHHCDNPPCCNPSHLYAGTQADNARDKIVRGRHKSRKSLILTPDQISEIRSDIRTQQAIADDYGVSRSYISLIRSNRRCSK